ncbi:MAG: hypothetical protein CM15mV13_0830 [uncultured marine virus]|nr:MAG: hypothetical protein CM15mV13_0830 [uncultured marine virus]
MKDSKNDKDSTGSAGNMDYDTINASAYSYSRWQLLNAITLDITVPGNVGLYVGMIIECLIPSSSKEENRTVPDPIYSGLYLVTGLEHSYTREGITTFLSYLKTQFKHLTNMKTIEDHIRKDQKIVDDPTTSPAARRHYKEELQS